jgi:tetratricopeptide (TPR) repeat protein/DNA-binding SARP family transcriptional activator
VVDRVWGLAPPDRARHTLYVYVTRLRHALGPSAPVVSRSGGYVLDVDPDAVDSHRFRCLVEQSRDPSCEVAQRVALLSQTLDLWRGVPLADVPSDWAARVREGWRQQRLDAAAAWAYASLDIGSASAVIGRLVDLTAEYPLAEDLAVVLMRALHLIGRTAEALDCYTRIRQRLAEELGVDPGAELRELHRAILRGNIAPPTSKSAVGPGHCLPRDVADFTGREAAVVELIKTAPDASADRATVAVITAVDGMPGIGKTALAVHVAHLVAGQYPDAQLFVDLYGHSEQAPLGPAAALGALLRQLGVAADRIPEPLDERVTMWRSELAGRRVLVVLDNAADTAQVSPLLPGSPSSLTLVTSRRRLVGLDGVHPVSLEVLSADEAMLLLERIVGNRASADPAGAAEVVRLCGHLPLAVRLAAARLAHRPKWSVADLARRLREATPLAELAADGRTVAAAFTLSYQHLGTEPQRVFRLLGLVPGADFDAYVTAALADLPVAQAAAILDDLDDAHLIEAKSADRYRLHDLLRDYARNLATATDPEPARQAAITRLLDYYLHTTIEACSHFDPGGETGRMKKDNTSVQTPQVDQPNRAEIWLDLEWQNVLAAIGLSNELGWHHAVLKLTRALWAHLWRRGHNTESIHVHERAIIASRTLTDVGWEASSRNYLASAFSRLGRLTDAVDQLEQALAIRRSQGDEVGESLTLYNLAYVYRSLGQFDKALDVLESSLAFGDDDRKRTALRKDAVGTIYLLRGKYDEALPLLRQNLVVARELKDPFLWSIALGSIGASHGRLGHHKLAIALLTRARQVKKDISHLHGEAETLAELGSVYCDLGRIDEALACHAEALSIVRLVGEPAVELTVLNGLGRVRLVAGDFAGAIEAHRTALALARRLEQRYQLARAHDGLAAAMRDREPATARDHWQQALELYTEMDVPDRFEVKRRLAELED